MSDLSDIVRQIELHSVQGIRACFSGGISPDVTYRGEPLLHELVSEYTRSPRFKDCVKAFVDYGLKYDDDVLLAVLLDDAAALQGHLQKDPELCFKKYTLRCAYTPLTQASLLHICAEFNHVACAQVLVRYGADINGRAGLDPHGFGGQTPIFHTVNQNTNQSVDMFHYLLTLSADLQVTVKGLIWGEGYDWETLIPSVNPISYAMMGLLPQMHRQEKVISSIVTTMLQIEYGIEYKPENVPCRYLQK